MKDINSLVKSAKNAIFYVEDAEAKKLLKQIESFINSPESQQTNPQLVNDLKKLIIYLKIVAFPNLSNQKAAEVLKNSYLESFEIDVSMENRLIGKLFMEPIIPRDDLRKQLKEALLQNQQKLGPLTISQWIMEFEKDCKVQERKPSSVVNFAINNTNAQKLDQVSQNKLKRILRTYDYLLVSTLPTTEPELSEILKTLGPEDNLFPASAVSGSGLSLSFGSSWEINSGKNVVDEKYLAKLPLSEALEKYPELGEQAITSNRLRLKNYPEPARPSIKNWLSDYTFNLGFSSHSAMDRGTYLFKNENAKILNSSDRERLSFILKAYDEKSPVDINTNTNQIIFPQHKTRSNKQGAVSNNQKTFTNQQFKKTPTPATQIKSASQPNRFQEIYNRQNQTNEPQDIFEKTRQFTGVDNYPTQKLAPQTKNLNFSSPQRFSHEKQNSENRKNIDQSSSNKNTPARNIVNLKEQKTMNNEQ